MLHSDAAVAAQLPTGTPQEKMRMLLDTFLELLGDTGTLLVPTFSYSFCRGEDFSIETSPSLVGQFTEFARVDPRSKRTEDPNFSFCVFGDKSEVFVNLAPDSSFGPGSVFERLYLVDGIIVFLGCSIEKATFVHWVEERAGVRYREHKFFSGNIVSGNRYTKRGIRYFARRLELGFRTSLAQLRKSLITAGRLQSAPLGRLKVESVRARDFDRVAMAMLEADPHALIQFEELST